MIKHSPFIPRLDVAIEGGPRYQKEKQNKIRKNNSSSLSSAMRGEYTLEPLSYGVHHRGVRLVELFESPLA